MLRHKLIFRLFCLHFNICFVLSTKQIEMCYIALFKNIETKWKFDKQGELKKESSSCFTYIFYFIFLKIVLSMYVRLYLLYFIIKKHKTLLLIPLKFCTFAVYHILYHVRQKNQRVIVWPSAWNIPELSLSYIFWKLDKYLIILFLRSEVYFFILLFNFRYQMMHQVMFVGQFIVKRLLYFI